MSNEDQLATLRARVAINENKIEQLARTVDFLVPCPEMPAMELASWEPGPARVISAEASSPHRLAIAINAIIEGLEGGGDSIESIQPMPLDEDGMYTALIVHRARAQQDDSSS